MDQVEEEFHTELAEVAEEAMRLRPIYEWVSDWVRFLADDLLGVHVRLMLGM
ncbi:TPA: hypothetical protein ACSP2E_004026 [Aeromonas hydrophila]